MQIHGTAGTPMAPTRIAPLSPVHTNPLEGQVTSEITLQVKVRIDMWSPDEGIKALETNGKAVFPPRLFLSE